MENQVFVMDHPLIQHKLSILRDKRTGSKQFRELVSEIAMLMCYESTRDLPLVETQIETPMMKTTCKKLKGRKLCFITDCLPAGGLPEGEYTLGGQKIIYRGIVCRLEDGTVAGSVLHLNRGVWNVFKNSSIPLWECVNGASLNPATVLGLEKTKGSIEVGKDADVIITDDNFEVTKTIIGGEIKYEA